MIFLPHPHIRMWDSIKLRKYSSGLIDYRVFFVYQPRWPQIDFSNQSFTALAVWRIVFTMLMALFVGGKRMKSIIRRHNKSIKSLAGNRRQSSAFLPDRKIYISHTTICKVSAILLWGDYVWFWQYYTSKLFSKVSSYEIFSSFQRFSN